jgi:hypothetical protein
MAAIIQKNKAFSRITGSGSVSVTLNPLSAGSKIVLVAALAVSDGSNAFSSANFEDQLNNTYTANALSSGFSNFAWTFYAVVSPAAGATTYAFNYSATAPSSGFTFLAGIAAYEVSGSQSVANATGASSNSSGFQNVNSITAALSGLNEGSFGNFIVSAGAFLDSSLTDAEGFSAGSGWTLDGSDAISGTNDALAVLFESQLTTGNPTGGFSGANDTNEIDGTVGILAILLTSAIGGGGSGGSGESEQPTVVINNALAEIHSGALDNLGLCAVVGRSGELSFSMGTKFLHERTSQGKAREYLGSDSV